MNSIFIKHIETKLGKLILGSYNNQLILVDWLHRKNRKKIDLRLQTHFNANYKEHTCSTLKKTHQQIEDYLSQKCTHFEIDIKLIGTPFQKKVWRELINIPFGKTISYSDLATNILKPNAYRAVANANAANPISIIVPCHRVITNSGLLGGYAGGTDTKEKLLILEKS